MPDIWLSSAMRIVSMVVFFAGIGFFLRFLYGPKGKLRPAEFGTEHIEVRRRKKAALQVLRKRLDDGAITTQEYLAERERIEQDDAVSA